MGSVVVDSTLAAPAAVVWAAVQRPEASVYVAGGMLRFPATERLSGPLGPWEEITGWRAGVGGAPIRSPGGDR